jgi:hypothetical protein
MGKQFANALEIQAKLLNLNNDFLNGRWAGRVVGLPRPTPKTARIININSQLRLRRVKIPTTLKTTKTSSIPPPQKKRPKSSTHKQKTS